MQYSNKLFPDVIFSTGTIYSVIQKKTAVFEARRSHTPHKKWYPLFPSLIFLASASSCLANNPSTGSEFEQVLASFGNIETIAGIGRQDRGQHWESSMEGGKATEAELSRPHNAMADLAGNVYIADKENHAIRKVDTNGIITTVAGLKVDRTTPAAGNGADEGVGTEIALNNPNGLYVHPNGIVYILDTANGKIRRLTTNGLIKTILTDPSGFGVGRGIWVSADEQLIYYSASTVIRKWTPEDGITNFAMGFSDLGNIDVSPESILFATDRGSNNVYSIDSEGNKTRVAGKGNNSSVSDGTALGTFLDQVRGIAFDHRFGGYYLVTHKGDQVWYVDTSDNIHLLINGTNDAHSGDGQPISTTGLKISEPRAISVAPNGDLLITEHDNGFIRRVTNVCIQPKIVNLSLESEHLSFSWTSHREGNYSIQRSTNLKDWSEIIATPGSNGSKTTFNAETISNQLFYRIKEIE